MCINKLIMTGYQEYLIKVEISTLDRVLPEKGKNFIRLGLKNNTESLIPNL